MPRKVILEDGSEIEVPTDEELADLNSKATKAAELGTEVERLKKESENKENLDWRLARKKMQKLEEQIQATGKKVNDDGTIVDPTTVIDTQEILKQATEIATKTSNEIALNRYRDEMLNSFDEETRKVVKHYYDKLSAGEELSFDRIRTLVSEASLHATPQGSSTATVRSGSGGGAPPRIKYDANGNISKTPFSDTDEGRNTANEIWGNTSYAAK